MTSERHQAYCAAKKTIDTLRGVRLHPDEYNTLYDAIEGRLLAHDPDGPEALQLAEAARQQLQLLVEVDRWGSEESAELYEQIEACAGPVKALA